jgi:uncharacterized protein
MPIDFWNTYQFRLESWGTDYDSPINFNDEENTTVKSIDLTVESEKWKALQPDRFANLPKQIVFVDGRCRLDSRFLGQKDREILYGVFATLAVGAVRVDRNTQRATCLEPKIKRAIAIGGNLTPPITCIPCPLGSNTTLRYDLCLTSSENNPKAALFSIQKAMLEAEARLAEQFNGDRSIFVIRDGPLLYGSYKSPGLTMGYVKTMGKQYLTGDAAKLLWNLKLGERTPIFSIGKPKSFKSHWSWYLRSGEQNIIPKKLGYHDLHGIVRLDLYSEVPLEKAVEIANLSTILIPEYASHPVRDPRAPQNLTPVGGLEKELGRHMGDKKVVERRIRNFLINQSLLSNE